MPLGGYRGESAELNSFLKPN